MLDDAEGVPDTVIAGRTRGNRTGIRPAGADFHGDMTRGHINDDHRDEKRRDAAGPFFEHDLMIVFDRWKAADARPNIHPGSIRIRLVDRET